jgi:hypothetical protein
MRPESGFGSGLPAKKESAQTQYINREHHKRHVPVHRVVRAPVRRAPCRAPAHGISLSVPTLYNTQCITYRISVARRACSPGRRISTHTRVAQHQHARSTMSKPATHFSTPTISARHTAGESCACTSSGTAGSSPPAASPRPAARPPLAASTTAPRSRPRTPR